MRIVWDLDGVLRDLNGYLARVYKGGYPKTWEHKFANGLGVVQCVEQDKNVLMNAPPTAYLKVAREYCREVEVWTSQPFSWRASTDAWCREYLPKGSIIHYLSPKEKERRLYKDAFTVLVEDSPNFKNYDKILLIDRPYNKEIQTAFRIFGTKHLANIVSIILGKE